MACASNPNIAPVEKSSNAICVHFRSAVMKMCFIYHLSTVDDMWVNNYSCAGTTKKKPYCQSKQKNCMCKCICWAKFLHFNRIAYGGPPMPRSHSTIDPIKQLRQHCSHSIKCDAKCTLRNLIREHTRSVLSKHFDCGVFVCLALLLLILLTKRTTFNFPITPMPIWIVWQTLNSSKPLEFIDLFFQSIVQYFSQRMLVVYCI